MSWEDKLDKELRFHIEQAIQDYVARGMSVEEARDRARREFGSVALAKDEIRDTQPLRWLADLAQDVRYALRGFRNRPGFAGTAVLVLALGIGANTAVFTLLHRVLLASLPVQNPHELYEVSCLNPAAPEEVGCTSSYAGFQMFAERKDIFSGIFAYYSELSPLNIVYQSRGEIASGLLASGDFFSVLGVTPAAGRLLNPSDDQPGAPPVAVLSYAYWQRRFGTNAQIVGQAVNVNGTLVTIIGVTPEPFRSVTFDRTPDLTFPLGSMTDALKSPGNLQRREDWWLHIIGRKRGDVPLAQAQAALEPTYKRTVEDLLDAFGAKAPASLVEMLRNLRFKLDSAEAGAASEMRRDLNRPLRILMGAVAMVLLIACANLAGLGLARSAARRREFGVRLALGASRLRIVRQLMAESLLLALGGAAAGLLISVWAGNLLLWMAAGDEGSRAVDTTPDFTVLAFTAGVSLVAMILVGLLPALRLASADPHGALKEVRAGKAAYRWSRVLIPAQVAFTSVLLMGAVLFLRTFDNFQSLDLGFRAAELLSFRVNPGLLKYDDSARRGFYDRLRRELESLPGVQSVTFSQYAVANVNNRSAVAIPGYEPKDFKDMEVSRNFAGARFAQTTGLRILQGRDLTEADQASPVRPSLVNESFARHFFGAANPIGRTFYGPGGVERTNPAEYTIAGVVADARDRGPKAAVERTVYVPLGTAPGDAFVTVRHASGGNLNSAVGELVRRIDPAVPVLEMQSVRTMIDSQLARERLLASLGAAFGALSLLLVAVGLYGLIAGAVTARTQELGIRLSLGAKPASVAWVVTRESLVLVLAGSAAGLMGGALLARLVESQLFGVSAADPWVYAWAALGLAAAAALAAYLPARRATRIDPIRALRFE